MNKIIAIGIGILVLVGGFIYVTNRTPEGGLLGFDRENTDSQPSALTEYDQVGITASRSQQDDVKTSGGKVYAIEITSDATSLRYFQIFDVVSPVVPSRAASISAGFQSQKIYLASNSWASAASLAARPLGSYQQYASRSLVYSVPIPAATSSASPTIVRIGSDFLSSPINFASGIIFTISSQFASYSSASVNTARHTVKLLYK